MGEAQLPSSAPPILCCPVFRCRDPISNLRLRLRLARAAPPSLSSPAGSPDKEAARQAEQDTEEVRNGRLG